MPLSLVEFTGSMKGASFVIPAQAGIQSQEGTSLVVRQVVGDIVCEDLVRGVSLNVLKRNLRIQGGAGTRDAGRGGSPVTSMTMSLSVNFTLPLPPFFCSSIIF